MLFLSKTSGPAAVRRHRRADPRRRLPRRLQPVDPHRCRRRRRGRRRPRAGHRRRRRRARRRARLHPHETTGALADEGGCATPDETEADEHYSQVVAAKANLTAALTLNDDGTLVGQEPRRHRATRTPSSSRRANPTNVVFRNDSDEDRRLVLDMGTRPARRRRQRDRRRRGPQPALHGARRGGRQPVPHVHHPGASPAPRRPTRSSSPASTGARIEVEVP